MNTEIITEIIETFGGQTAMADALDVPISTVESWRTRGNIPRWRHDSIIKAARGRKITLPQQFIEEIRK